MEGNVKERIRKQYSNLTASQKIITKLVLDKPGLMAVHPAKKIAEMTSTSEATVIRFCYALGYSGYSELQDEIRKSLLLPDQQKGPMQKYHDSSAEVLTRENFIQHAMEADLAYIQQELERVDYELYKEAVESIVRAEKIVIIGLRWCHIPAKWLYSTLNAIKGNTYLYTGAADNADYLITEREQKWLVIALSFPRHPSETISFVHAAKQVEAQVLAITEGELSPISQLADLLLKVTTPQPVATSGMAALFSVMNALMKGVMIFDAEKVQARLRQYDDISRTFYSFVGEDDDFSTF